VLGPPTPQFSTPEYPHVLSPPFPERIFSLTDRFHNDFTQAINLDSYTSTPPSRLPLSLADHDGPLSKVYLCRHLLRHLQTRFVPPQNFDDLSRAPSLCHPKSSAFSSAKSVHVFPVSPILCPCRKFRLPRKCTRLPRNSSLRPIRSGRSLHAMTLAFFPLSSQQPVFCPAAFASFKTTILISTLFFEHAFRLLPQERLPHHSIPYVGPSPPSRCLIFLLGLPLRFSIPRPTLISALEIYDRLLATAFAAFFRYPFLVKHSQFLRWPLQIANSFTFSPPKIRLDFSRIFFGPTDQ